MAEGIMLDPLWIQSFESKKIRVHILTPLTKTWIYYKLFKQIQVLASTDKSCERAVVARPTRNTGHKVINTFTSTEFFFKFLIIISFILVDLWRKNSELFN